MHPPFPSTCTPHGNAWPFLLGCSKYRPKKPCQYRQGLCCFAGMAGTWEFTPTHQGSVKRGTHCHVEYFVTIHNLPTLVTIYLVGLCDVKKRTRCLSHKDPIFGFVGFVLCICLYLALLIHGQLYIKGKWWLSMGINDKGNELTTLHI